MNGQTNNVPNEAVTIEALIVAPFSLIIQTWESIQPPSQFEPELFVRSTAILAAMDWLTGHPKLDKLRKAINAHDEHGLGALVQLDGFLLMTCDTLIERCKRWRREEDWTTLHHEAALAARLTAAAGRDGQRALALFLLATAHRALGDILGTINVYKTAIEVAWIAHDEHLLAVSNDNLGNALTDVGRLDEALGHYDEALIHEHDPAGRRAIRKNRANALEELGELRLAVLEHKKAIKELEDAGVHGRELAVMLDNLASPIARLGEPKAALDLLEKARLFFEPGDLPVRVVNALSRSTIYGILRDKKAAAETFVEAHDLAFEDARRRIDPEHYRRGFLEARRANLPSDDEANRLLFQGMRAKDTAKDADAWKLALKLLHQATHRAQEAGDHALALRINANIAAIFADELGLVDQALTIALRVCHEAAERGLARPEFMAIGTLGSLSARGADIRDPLGPLGAFVRAAVLLEVHRRIVADAGLNPKDAKLETYDPGMGALELAIQAEKHNADLLAVRYYQEAVNKAQAVQGWVQLVNRLAGLRSALSRSGNIQESEKVAEEIKILLARGVLPFRGQLVAHRDLGFHFAVRDRTIAINHLRKACSILEELSQPVEPGDGRSCVGYEFHDMYRTLARLLREIGNDTASFEALQGEKGRRLIDALTTLETGEVQGSAVLPKVDEVLTLIKRLSAEKPTYLVDLAVEEEGLTAYLVGDSTVRAIHVDGDPSDITAIEGGDVSEREVHLVKMCLQNSLLRDLAGAVTAALPKGCRILLVPDQFLYNLPLHIIPVEEQFWCDHFSIGYLMAAGVLRFAPGRHKMIGRSLVAGNSRNDLPYAAAECAEVATLLDTKPIVGSDCTRAAIEEALRAGEFDVVHLALHGRGDGRRGGRASLLLADGRGGTEWIAFDELATVPWRTELVIFSGCSTAVAGPRQGRELVSVSLSAAERGAAAVIACLWPVGDKASKVFMTAFYKELVLHRAAGPVDLRVVLDKARKELRTKLPGKSVAGARRRDGRSLRPAVVSSPHMPKVDPAVADALRWAPFILLGDPILGG